MLIALALRLHRLRPISDLPEALAKHMYINNESLIRSLAHPAPHKSPAPRFPALPPSPILLRQLPPTSHLIKLSKDSSKAAQHRQALEASLSSALETPLDAHPAPAEQRHPPVQTAGLKGIQSRIGGKRGGGKFEASDVLKAIDKKVSREGAPNSAPSTDLCLAGHYDPHGNPESAIRAFTTTNRWRSPTGIGDAARQEPYRGSDRVDGRLLTAGEQLP